MVCLRSSPQDLFDIYLMPFLSALTTMAFDHSRRERFETSSCKPIPMGLPSSFIKLRTAHAVLVAHSRSALATPVGPVGLAKMVDWMLPARYSTLSALPRLVISGLNDTARTFAVYALQPPSPTTTQDSLAACWLDFDCTGLSPVG